MRKFLLLWVVLASSLAFSQLATVTATITDSDGTAWANGSYIATFQPSPTAVGQSNFQGNPNFTKQFQGSLSGTGSFSISNIPRNDFIAPSGSTWTFTICPNASYQCSNVINISITSASPNLSSILSGGVSRPRMGAGPNTYGYTDVEIGTPASPVWPGATYFNVTGLTYRQWNGSSWVTVGSGGGGGGIPGGASSQFQYNCSGSFCGSSDFTYNSSVLTGGSTLNFNLSGAAHTTPHLVGVNANKPSTCAIGEEYYATDASVGQNLYFCTSTNTWTQMTGGGISGPGSSVSGNIASWSNSTGSSLSDSGIAASSVTFNSTNFVASNLIQATGNHSTADSGISAPTVVTSSSPFTTGNLIQSASTTRTTADSGISASNVVTASANLTSGNIPKAAGNNKTLVNGYGVQGTDANLITSGSISGTANTCIDANGGITNVGCSAGATVNSSLQFSSPYYSASGSSNTLSGIAPPTTNGFWVTGYNVTAGTAVAPGSFLQGVPVNNQSGNYTLQYSDRAAYIKEQGTSTSTLTLPQIAGNIASNFPFITQNLNSGTETIQANAADKIDGGALGGTSTLPPNWIAWIYQDSSSSPGNWWTVKTPNLQAFPNCNGAANGMTFNTASSTFGCNSYSFANFAPTPVRTGDIIYWNGSTWTTLAGNNTTTGFLQETSAGVPSWSAGSTTVGLNSVVAASGANSINNGDNAQTWNWSLTTASKSAFTFGENVASTATGTPILLNVQTLASSTALPLQVTSRGTANGVQMTTAGLLTPIGTGGINATQLNGTAFAGTNGDVVTFGASNTPVDSGILGTNVVTLAGTQTLTNKTITSGKYNSLTDTNGNPGITLSATTSAVDGLTITNAAAANPATVTVAATGSDANININLVSKGAGVVQCNGVTCGTGGGGSGTVNSGTAGHFSYYATSTNAVSNNSNLDDGATTTNALTYAGSAGVSAVSYTTTGTGSGLITLTGSTSGSAAISTAAVAGTPSIWLMPTTDGTNGQFLQFATPVSGKTQLVWATPAGGGNVSNSGTPTAHQVPVWQTATSINGVGPGSANQLFISNGSSSDPGYVTTLPTAAMPALTGDVTNTAGSLATTVGKVNGASIPISAAALASNASNQIIAATMAGTGAGIVTGPTTVTSGDLPSYTGTTGQQVDSGIVAANVITAASSATTANQVEVSSGASKSTQFIDFPDSKSIPFAICVNGTGAIGGTTTTSVAATCRAGTNNKDAFIGPFTTSDTLTFKIHLPKDWDTATNPYLDIDLASTDATNAHTVILQESVACAKLDGSTTDDVAFNAARSMGTVTLNGNANRTWNTTLQFNSTDMTGCSAPGIMWIKITRTTDTATNVELYQANVTIPRLITVQAN